MRKSYLKGGAGLCGTAEDYFKFLQMLANGGEYQGKRYLSRKTVEFMLQDHLVGMGGSTEASTGPGYDFGLGFAVRSAGRVRSERRIEGRCHVERGVRHRVFDRSEGARQESKRCNM